MYLLTQEKIVDVLGKNPLVMTVRISALDKFSGKKVGTVICGGNIDARLFASILNRKLLMD